MSNVLNSAVFLSTLDIFSFSCSVISSSIFVYDTFSADISLSVEKNISRYLLYTDTSTSGCRALSEKLTTPQNVTFSGVFTAQ